MNKIRILTYTVIGLIVINLALIAFILFRKPPHRNPDGPRNEIIEKLHFDDTQVAAYDLLIKDHRSSIRTAEDKIMQLKNELYGMLSDTLNTARKDSLIWELCNVQKTIEETHYAHFEAIRTLCNPDQQDEFELLTRELAELFSHRPPEKK
ncbi:MAG: hypothetical protein HYZ14_10810 [Bacteroidetes bacterium]|nr:hypothetical protein [Bacteroidota bacterium]